MPRAGATAGATENHKEVVMTKFTDTTLEQARNNAAEAGALFHTSSLPTEAIDNIQAAAWADYSEHIKRGGGLGPAGNLGRHAGPKESLSKGLRALLGLNKKETRK